MPGAAAKLGEPPMAMKGDIRLAGDVRLAMDRIRQVLTWDGPMKSDEIIRQASDDDGRIGAHEILKAINRLLDYGEVELTTDCLFRLRNESS
jgi:hypothetical protein